MTSLTAILLIYSSHFWAMLEHFSPFSLEETEFLKTWVIEGSLPSYDLPWLPVLSFVLGKPHPFCWSRWPVLFKSPWELDVDLTGRTGLEAWRHPLLGLQRMLKLGVQTEEVGFNKPEVEVSAFCPKLEGLKADIKSHHRPRIRGSGIKTVSLERRSAAGRLPSGTPWCEAWESHSHSPVRSSVNSPWNGLYPLLPCEISGLPLKFIC